MLLPSIFDRQIVGLTTRDEKLLLCSSCYKFWTTAKLLAYKAFLDSSEL